METIQQTTFIITREDRTEEPKTIVGEGLKIGRLPDSDIWLNHPKVSRLHAGINKLEGYFYLINLSASSATTLNGRVISFNEAQEVTDGDEIQIGPFFLKIQHTDQTLRITVVLQFALNPGEREPLPKQLADESGSVGSLEAARFRQSSFVPPVEGRSADGSAAANALKLFWNKRTREKAGRPSPLHPLTPPRPGKARFNWMPTRDLVRPWPFAIFVWATIVVGALSALAALGHKNAFAPESISDAHTRQAFTLTPAIAKQPNGSSCSSCHVVGVSVANKEKVNANCAACHHTEAFVATVTSAHREAGITCTTCHAEHRGETFGPMKAALESCAKCHNDQTRHLYNGKTVHTPHGGTYGYPVVNGVWVWKGLDAEELAQKPYIVASLKKNRVNANETNQWRNAQFHGIHLNRVRAVEGIDGIYDEVAGTKVLSCSSCHKTGYMGANVDRTYPRTTCGRCHNARVFNEGLSADMSAETPSCTSCHVQHVRDTRWASTLRLAETEARPAFEIKE